MSSAAIASRLGELPSLPAVYHRVCRVLDDPNGTLHDLAAVIESETSLAARVLKVANSAYYGFPGKVDTARQAVAIVGASDIRHLLLATTIIAMFRDIPLGAVSMRSFWEHAIATGIASRCIAQRRRSGDPHRYYLAGLLHDIGRLALLLLEPAAMSEILLAHRARRGQLWELERQVLDTTHGEVGAWLLQNWNLPSVYRSVAEWHHQGPAQAEFAAEAAAVHVADLVANGLRIGTSGTHWVPPLDETAWDLTGLDADDMEDIAEVTTTAARDVSAAFLDP